MKKKLIIFSITMSSLIIVSGLFLIFTKNKDVLTDKNTKKIITGEVETSDNKELLEITAPQQAVIVNDSSETPSEKRGAIKTENSATQAEIDEAAKAGEHKQSVFDITLDDNIKISEKDIANARETLKNAGINATYYSDYDIALIIKHASDNSLDVVTVIEKDDWLDE